MFFIISRVDFVIEIAMSDFNASSVAYEVQKCFSDKFFSHKLVAMNLIEDTTARLLDDLFLLLHAHVSRPHTWQPIWLNFVLEPRQERFREDYQKYDKNFCENWDVGKRREV